MKGRFSWSHAVLSGWGVQLPTKHTVPMTSFPAALICVHFSSLGYARLGGGQVLQQRLGLRPGEVTTLVPEDICFPEEVTGIPNGMIIIGVGMRKGTKLKRPQAAYLDPSKNGDVAELLRRFKRSTPPGHRLVPHSLDCWRRMLKEVESRLNLTVGWTPHSGRAGFASEMKALGMPFLEIREAGRWTMDASLRVYIDTISAVSITTMLQHKGLVPALQWARACWLNFCTEPLLAAAYPNQI